jgi:ATP-dependent helicase HrpB
VSLHLLSPARRPVQITQDLGGFWRGSYAQVRRELRGRYPRHPWPEDPAQAMPTTSGPKARSPQRSAGTP